MSGVSPVITQIGFRARSDSVGLNVDTWDKEAQDVDFSQNIDEVFRLRLLISDTVASTKSANRTFGLEFSLNGGAFTAVGASAAVSGSLSAHFVDDDLLTPSLLAGGQNTFVTGRGDTNGIAPDAGNITLGNGNDHTEIESCLIINSAQVANNDTIVIRATGTDATPTSEPTITAVAAGGSPQTIPVGAVAETEAAQAVAATQTVAVGIASETETAQSLQIAGAWTDAVVATTPISIAVGTVAEIEAAQSVDAAQTTIVPVGQVSETEAVQPVGVSATATVTAGLAAETETAQPVAAAPGTVVIVVGAVAETESAQSVDAAQTTVVPVGTASETETAQSLQIAGAWTAPVVATTPISITVGPVSETESAQTVTPQQTGGGAQTIPVGAVTESEAAVSTGLTSTVSIPVGADSYFDEYTDQYLVGAVEFESAQPVTPVAGPVSIPVGVASETESARTVNPVEGGAPQTIAVGVVAESEAPQAVGVTAGLVSIAVGAAAETETAQPVTSSQVGAPQTIAVGAVAEVESVQTVVLSAGILVSVGVVAEAEVLPPVGITTGPTTIPVGTVSETETAWSVFGFVGEKRRRLEGAGVSAGSTEGSKTSSGFLEGSKV